jgi:hypothetical protein
VLAKDQAGVTQTIALAYYEGRNRGNSARGVGQDTIRLDK